MKTALVAAVLLSFTFSKLSAQEMPANAHKVPGGAGWECNDGYVKRTTACLSLFVATDSEIRTAMIAMSLKAYSGTCPCPEAVDRAGRRCGQRSAYSRAGGKSVLCYPADISAEQVRATREKYRPRNDDQN